MTSLTNELLVRRMLDAIDGEYADVLTVRTLGARIGRQPAYLGHVFRTALGLTVRQCWTRIRLERAAEMIRAGTKIEAVSPDGRVSQQDLPPAIQAALRHDGGRLPTAVRCDDGAPAGVTRRSGTPHWCGLCSLQR